MHTGHTRTKEDSKSLSGSCAETLGINRNRTTNGFPSRQKESTGWLSRVRHQPRASGEPDEAAANALTKMMHV